MTSRSAFTAVYAKLVRMGFIRYLPILIIMTVFAGCAPTTQSQYRVLSFFFDGVPKPKDAASEKQTEGETQGGNIPKKEKILYREHGPYAAKLCDGCHELSTNALVAPKDELCFRCHEFRMDKKWVHGPLASGGCMVCHDPHGSQYRFLLVSEAETFCYYCHDAKNVEKDEAHTGDYSKCTSCHNAHMSDRKYLLK